MAVFAIHALPVARGILALSPLPGRGGQYADDLKLLRNWQPGLAISMTTRAEMVAHGAENLGMDLQDMGTRWVHLPVEDFSIPDPLVAEAWHAASTGALSALEGGGRVLIHCKGGCGRSGMAVLRLMIQAGEDPAAALKRLRTIRPCAIETVAQMQWAWRG